MLTESGGSRNRTGGLSVSLASPDGRVVGGGVGGMLIAAGPVQVKLLRLIALASSYPVQSKLFSIFHSELVLNLSMGKEFDGVAAFYLFFIYIY